MVKIAFRSERGQSLLIVTLLIVAMMGMLAIILDGGNGFFQRRTAQNAADAGALAGARELCLTGDRALAENRAWEYAVEWNGAVSAEATADANTGLVAVTAYIPFNTTFGQVLGQNEITAAGFAEAGCFTPGSGDDVLPIAWSCRAGQLEISPDGCNVEFGEENPYIIMDSLSSDEHCAPLGNLICDIDDPPDGRPDILRGGDRSWLDLNGPDDDTVCGGGGSQELSCWLVSGYGTEILVHTWAPEGGGVAANIFQTAYEYYGYPGAPKWGKVLLLPVFDYACQGDPQGAPCTDWHGEDLYAGDPPNTVTNPCPSGIDCYHIIAWSGFVITCVSDKTTRVCPLKTDAVAASEIDPNIGYTDNVKTIEGYFVQGFIPNASIAGGAAKAGLYTLKLTK